MPRTVLITGAAGEIGRASVELFQRQGWTVCAVDADPGPGLPDGVRFKKLDATDPSQVESIVEWVEAESGQLDALVNIIKTPAVQPLLEIEVDDWQRALDISLRPAYLSIRYAQQLTETQGSVVNVAPASAAEGPPEPAALAASRGGLIALTRAMSLELGPDQARANAVLPGVVDPDQVAHAVYFLADSAQSSFITGQSLAVDGGAAAGLSTELNAGNPDR